MADGKKKADYYGVVTVAVITQLKEHLKNMNKK